MALRSRLPEFEGFGSDRPAIEFVGVALGGGALNPAVWGVDVSAGRCAIRRKGS